MTLLVRQQLLPLEIGNTPVSVGPGAARLQRILQLCPWGSPTLGYDFLKHFDPGWREYFVENIFLLFNYSYLLNYLPTQNIWDQYQTST